MPRSPRGATRRSAQRKPPLTVDALWAIRRIGTPTISPDGALACSAVTRFDMEKNEGSTSLWLFPTGLGGRATAGRARMLTAGDKDSRSEVVARRQVDRIHREAQGRRGAAALRDRAGRRRGEAPDAPRDRLRGAEMVCRRHADRVHLVGVAGPRDRRAAGEAPQGAQGREGEGARHRAQRIPLLGPLARRRPRAACLRLRRRDGTLPRRARRDGARAAALGSVGRAFRHRARRSRDRDHRRPRAPSRR